jgi:D-inositol-3-phosphate glycosyltransferase
LFLGTLTDEEVQQQYRQADAVVYVPFDEPMGLVPLEAALHEVPAVVSNHGGPAEVVIHEQTGLHVDAASPEEIADALHRLAGDEALRHRLGAAARERVLREMSFARYLAILEESLRA